MNGMANSYEYDEISFCHTSIFVEI